MQRAGDGIVHPNRSRIGSGDKKIVAAIGSKVAFVAPCIRILRRIPLRQQAYLHLPASVRHARVERYLRLIYGRCIGLRETRGGVVFSILHLPFHVQRVQMNHRLGQSSVYALLSVGLPATVRFRVPTEEIIAHLHG